MASQTDLFPPASPAGVALVLGSVVGRAERLLPLLTPEQCLFLLGELSLLARALDTVDPEILERRRYGVM